MMGRVSLNVSGVVFGFDSKLLEPFPEHTLHEMCADAGNTCKQLELTVDRPSEYFAAILAYYQTGELHMPSNVCPNAFKLELQYWKIEDSELQNCCYYRYHSFYDTADTQDKFRIYRENIENGDVWPPIKDRRESKVNLFRRRLWSIIDNKENSVIAKLYLAVMFLLVMTCIITLALNTDAAFQRRVTKCEMLEYMEYYEHDAFDRVKESFGEGSCQDQSEIPPEYFYEDLDNKNQKSVINDSFVTTSEPSLKRPTVRLPNISLPIDTLRYTEIVVTAFFTVDLLLRLFSCPSFKKYFKSIVNLIDILALLGFYAHEILINIRKGDKYTIGWVKIIGYIQILRSFRLFRVAKNVRASHVLAYSLRQNITDMSLLVLLLIIGVSISANVMYFVDKRENIKSITEAWYWALITLTTVGYGDITPQTTWAKVVASLLAICGVLLLSITLPMFVNNFLTLYQYSCLEESIASKRDKQKGGTEERNGKKCNKVAFVKKKEKVLEINNKSCEESLDPYTGSIMPHLPGQTNISTPNKTEKHT